MNEWADQGQPIGRQPLAKARVPWPVDDPSQFAPFEQACKNFESAWRTGAAPRIDDYLDSFPAAARKPLLHELLLLDLEYRCAGGQRPSLLEYTARYPDAVEVVAAAFDAFWSGGVTRFTPGELAPDAPSAKRELAAEDLLSQERTHALVAAWPFSDLPRDVLRAFAAHLQDQSFQPGDVLIQQGAPGKGLLVIVAGKATVLIQDAEHGQRQICQVGPGDVVGEMSLLTREPCTATVAATQPVEALLLSAADFYGLISREPGFAVMLSQLMAERLDVADDILVGRTIGEYKILRCIGRGGMAGVFEASKSEADSSVAVKMMSHRYTYDRQMSRRFQSESSIASALDHPHIVRTYEQFAAFNTRFIVMELCTGGTLAELLRREALAEATVRRMLGQLAAALDHAHSCGVVHRDLKPSNVLLDERGDVKLADFGLAQSPHVEGLTAPNCLLGTPRYMAPEQLAGQTVDQRADLYGLGLIAYEMLVGRPAFPERNLEAQIDRRRNWILPAAEDIRPGLSRDLYRLLRLGLARHPNYRRLNLKEVAAWADDPGQS